MTLNLSWPNVVTIVRLLMVFVLVMLAYGQSMLGRLLAALIAVLIVAGDWLDGYLARKLDQESALGSVLDIVADRILENVMWIILADLDLIPIWIPVVVIPRGILTDSIRNYALRFGYAGFGDKTIQLRCARRDPAAVEYAARRLDRNRPGDRLLGRRAERHHLCRKGHSGSAGGNGSDSERGAEIWSEPLTGDLNREPACLAFWDVDGTLVRSSMESHFVHWLRENGHAGVAGILRNAAAITIEQRRCSWHLMKLAYLRGCSVEEVRSWTRDCWEEEIIPSLHARPAEAVMMLRKRGLRQVLLTGGPRLLVEHMAAYLGLEDIIAAEPAVVDGAYTGGLIEPHPIKLRKVAAAERWLKQHGFSWEQTAAVADHYDDRFLLERVALPIAMNPGRRLMRLAIERGWHVFQPQDNPKEFIKTIVRKRLLAK